MEVRLRRIKERKSELSWYSIYVFICIYLLDMGVSDGRRRWRREGAARGEGIARREVRRVKLHGIGTLSGDDLLTEPGLCRPDKYCPFVTTDNL